MLVLSRRRKERIVLRTESGEEINISIRRIGANVVKLGVEAPSTVNVIRSEVLDREEKHV